MEDNYKCWNHYLQFTDFKIVILYFVHWTGSCLFTVLCCGCAVIWFHSIVVDFPLTAALVDLFLCQYE